MTMTVLTIGTFDLFHLGHLRLLQRAAQFGHLEVGVNSDKFVREYKGSLPVVPEAERMEIVGALKCVGRALLNDGPGVELIYRLRPNYLVIGSDWHARDYLAQIDIKHQTQLDALGTGIVYLPRTPGVSTTERRNAL